MSQTLSAITRATPCCARITPTRTTGWRSLTFRLVEHLRAAWHGVAQGLQRQEPLAELDAATLRDLGLSHAPAAWTRHERNEPPWR